MVLDDPERPSLAPDRHGHVEAAQLVPPDFLEALGVAVYTTDANGIITSFNEAAVELWGRRPRIGKDLWCGSWKIYRTDGTQLPHDQCPMGVALKENRPVRGEEAIAERPDGTRVWFVPYPTPLHDAEGHLIGAVNVLVDVTEGRRAERVLAESEHGLHDFFESSAVAHHWVGPDGIILRANQAELDMLGYTESEYAGRHIAEFHVDAEVIDDILRRLSNGDLLRDYEARLRCKDGSVVDVLIDSSVLWRDGEFAHTRCFTRNVTESKRADEAAAYLGAIVASSDDAIVGKDLDGTITSWNDGARRLFGFTAEEVIGSSIYIIIPDDRRDEEAGVLARVRRGDRVDHFETVRRRKDGTLVPISLTVSPVRGRNGSIIGASKVARDISERKRSEAAIAEALAVKDEFISLVSHELRTPLTTILGNAEILSRREKVPDEESRRSASEDVYREAVRLNRIIDDLLSLAHLERETIEPEPVALTRIVERAMNQHRETSARELRLQADDEPVVLGDESLIGHVLRNYLSNADKYSPPASVIDVIIDSSDGQGRVRVLDRGRGIDPDEAELLFESFYRSKNVGHVSGMGIGLAVSRRLVRAMDGDCWASSREDGGSEFGFSLPCFDMTPD